MSKPLKFRELEEGARFIAFPMAGDDHGHGGYRKGLYLFTKLAMSEGKRGQNAFRNHDGALVTWLPDMEVLKIDC